LSRHGIAKLGLTRTFQTPSLFPGLSVVENLMIGRFTRTSSGVLSCLAGLPRVRREEKQTREYAEKLMELLQVSHVRHSTVTDLAYGVQKRVELGRALAQEPRVLLLDEPMAGMTLEEKEDMCALLLTARSEFGITTILVEHDMGVVMDLSDQVVVLNFGKKLVSGPAAEVKNDPAVVAAYLGSTADDPKGLVS
jgi:branched-chain amino acid transport system ATP-binding protein